MSLGLFSPIFGGLGFPAYTSNVVQDQDTAQPEQAVEIVEALKRTNNTFAGPLNEFAHYGVEGQCPAFPPCPVLSVPIIWRMRSNPAIVLVSTVVGGPILAGSREYKVIDDKGQQAKAEQIKDHAQKMLLPRLNRALHGAMECLHFGNWLQELVWDRVNGQTEIADVRSILPLEAVLHEDAGRKFTGYSIDNQYRDARYGFLAVNQPHIDPVRGFSRNQNALRSWWRAERSEDNADRIERKASGISMKIGVPQGASFQVPDASGVMVDILPREMVQKIANSAAQGQVFVVPLTPFSKEAIQSNPELAKIEAVSTQEFDWGDIGQSLKAHLDRLDRLDRSIIRAWCRPEREATEAEHGSRADSQSHGQVGITDSELVHSNICEQWDEQVTRRWELTNYGHEWVGTLKANPAQLSDPQQEFYQKLYLQLVADPDTGQDTALDIDERALAGKTELPLRDPEEVKKDRAALADQNAEKTKQTSNVPVKVNGQNGENGNGLHPRAVKAVNRLFGEK